MPDGDKRKARSQSVQGKRTHTIKTKSGGKADVRKKSVEDARAGRGAFSKPTKYKGKTIKNKSGKMSGYTTHDGKYTRTTNTVSRKKAQKAIEYDKKKHASQSKTKSERNARFANAKKKGS